MLSIFNEAVSEENTLVRKTFHLVFQRILQSQNIIYTQEIQDHLNHLFTLFENENEHVDFNTVGSGLSILCGGNDTRMDKVPALFSLFDCDGNDRISFLDMKIYLTSVYKILGYSISTTINNASELAHSTVKEAFVQVHENEHGYLSYDEFKAWYSTFKQVLPPVFTLEEVRHLTTLESREAIDAISIFANGVNEDGLLNKRSFQECFNNIIGDVIEEMNEKQVERAQEIINKLYSIFDTTSGDGDDSGVDFIELSCGLSILCGGNSSNKVASAFELYDLDHSGNISPGHMQLYLTSVFRVLFGLDPYLSSAAGGASPQHLAHMTTLQAFHDNDVMQDGKLSLEEFTRWYTKHSFELTSQQSEGSPTSVQETSSNSDTVSGALEEARHLTNLENYDAADILTFFQASAGTGGKLDKSKFYRCFNKLITKNGGVHDRSKQQRIKDTLERLFCLFDTDQNGTVDVKELSAGLSLLCGGSRDDKALSAFSLYDTNGDGFISFTEMTTYLNSVFKVLYESSPEMRTSMGASPIQLSLATARQCFEDCDVNGDGQLSKEEFKNWYSSPKQNTLREYTETPCVTVAEARECTGLGHATVDDMIVAFSTVAGKNKSINRKTFTLCFHALANVTGMENKTSCAKLENILDRLFCIFDTNGNGTVEVNELASGLSVLASGTRDAKVEAAFSLYDTNGDGELLVYF